MENNRQFLDSDILTQKVAQGLSRSNLTWPSLLLKPLPNTPLQSPPNIPRNTHPRIQPLHPIPLPLLLRRHQTQRREAKIAVVQIRPLVAGELAETAHDRVLRQREEVVAQRGRGRQV